MSFIETGITSSDKENFYPALKLVLNEPNPPNRIVCDSVADGLDCHDEDEYDEEVPTKTSPNKKIPNKKSPNKKSPNKKSPNKNNLKINLKKKRQKFRSVPEIL